MSIKRKQIALFICCMIWALIAGLRSYDVGNDTGGYAKFISGEYFPTKMDYGTVDNPEESLEVVFVYTVKIVTLLSNNATIVFLIFYIVQFTFIYISYKRANVKFALWSFALFLILNFSHYAYLVVAFRQSVSITFLLIAVCLFEKRRNSFINAKGFKSKLLEVKWSILFIVLSMSCHRTSFLICPLVLIAEFITVSKKTAYIAIIVSMIFSLFLTDTLGFFVDVVISSISSVENEKIALLSDRYANTFSDLSNEKSMFVLISRPAIVLFSLYHYDFRHKSPLYFNSLLLFSILFSSMHTSYMGNRISLIFGLIGSAIYIPNKVQHNSLVKCAYLIITIGYLYKCFTMFNSWNTYEDSFLPYKFFFE